MTIPPLPPTSIASIAGSDRAASSRVAHASVTDNAASNAAASGAAEKTVDSVDKGTASDDSEADGRQMLDTFERQSKDETPDDEKQKAKVISDKPAPANGEVKTRIDFTA